MLISDELIYRTKSAAPNRSDQQNKNPPVVCLGRARVDDRWATVSPYSPCCFQE